MLAVSSASAPMVCDAPSTSPASWRIDWMVLLTTDAPWRDWVSAARAASDAFCALSATSCTAALISVAAVVT